MDKNIYQSWLTDRGINSPGGQPFDLLNSSISSQSSVLIVAQTSQEGAAEVFAAVGRLAIALKTSEQIISWVVVSDQGEVPNLRLLRSLIPQLRHAIFLVSTLPLPDSASFPIETKELASRPIHIIYGPTISQMNQNLETKRQFWNQLRTWMSV